MFNSIPFILPVFKFCFYFQTQHLRIVSVKSCLSRKQILGRSERRARNWEGCWLEVVQRLSWWSHYSSFWSTGLCNEWAPGYSQVWGIGWASRSTPSAAELTSMTETFLYLLRKMCRLGIFFKYSKPHCIICSLKTNSLVKFKEKFSHPKESNFSISICTVIMDCCCCC